MAQTAVEQLEEQFKRVGLLPKTAPESHMYHSIIAQAKQMEREQMEKAYIQLLFSDCQTFEQYYTQTYGNNQNK